MKDIDVSFVDLYNDILFTKLGWRTWDSVCGIKTNYNGKNNSSFYLRESMGQKSYMCPLSKHLVFSHTNVGIVLNIPNSRS